MLVNKSTKLWKFPRGESVFLIRQTLISDFFYQHQSRVSKEFKELCGVTTHKSQEHHEIKPSIVKK